MEPSPVKTRRNKMAEKEGARHVLVSKPKESSKASDLTPALNPNSTGVDLVPTRNKSLLVLRLTRQRKALRYPLRKNHQM